jgi:integrase
VPVNLIKRHGFWHIDDTLGPPGRRVHVRQSTKTADKAKAQRFATELEGKIWSGHFDGPEAILTFATAAQSYRAARMSDRFLGPIEGYLGVTLIKDIKPSTIRQMAIELYGHCDPQTQNRMGITPAQAVINFAAKAELCSPIRVERFKENPKVKEPATLEWVRAFRTTATPELGAMALFMFLTGCRPSEALAVDFERDVDLTNLDSATAIIRNTKIGNVRTAHLPRELAIELANLPRQPGRPLFWYRNLKVVRWPWDQAVKRAKIKRLTPHCCRHGCVTQLLRLGHDVVTVGWLVDMTPEMVLETYGHALKDATVTSRLLDTPLPRETSDIARSLLKSGTS